jgi:hypothetical protein
MKQKSSRKGLRRRPKAVQMGIAHPPPIRDYAIQHSRRMRFVANAAYTGTLTYQNLLDTLLVATSAVAGSCLFTAVRIRYVELYAVPILGQAATVQLVFDGQTVGAAGDQRVITDTSMGIEPAHLKGRPQARSGASLFQVSSATAAFYLSIPAGTVVDVGLDFKQALLGGTVACQNALVGATPGAQYLRGLDGLAIATTKLAAPFAAI